MSTVTPVLRLVSGGQTGADRAALNFASADDPMELCTWLEAILRP